MSTSNTQAPTRVLLVEDNPLDVRLLHHALDRERDWIVETIVAPDGEQAILLLEAAAAGGHEKPDLIVLDLNLPKRDGTQVLQVIRASAALRDLPVAIVSSAPTDVIEEKLTVSSLKADCCLTKPMDVDEFLALGKELRACYELNRARAHSNGAS